MLLNWSTNDFDLPLIFTMDEYGWNVTFWKNKGDVFGIRSIWQPKGVDVLEKQLQC